MKTALPKLSSKTKPAAVPQAPAAVAPLELPRPIRRQLRRLSARTVRVAWAEGALWIVMAACVLVFAQACLDWFLDLSHAIRIALLAGDGAIGLGLFYYYGVRPVIRRPGLEAAALQAERHWPGLRNAIISSVQLSMRPDGAHWMVERLIRRTAALVEKMDFCAAVPARHLRRRLGMAVLAAIAIAGAYAGLQPQSPVLLRRVGLSNEPLPTQTRVIPLSGDFRIPPGKTVELAVRAEGVIPRSGRLEITYSGKAPQIVPLVSKPSTPGLFSFTLQNVQQPFEYRFFLNDGRGPEFAVRIIQPPVLEGVKFEQVYPVYTGLASTQHSAGNLTLLAGSKLHIAGRADRQLKSAVVNLEGIHQQVPMKIAADCRSIAGEIDIPAQGLKGISVALQDGAGVESANDTVYQVQVTPDKPPVITIAPGQPEETTLLATDNPRVRFTASDDFKVKEVYLCCEIPGEGQGDAARQIKKIPVHLPAPAAALTFDYEFKNPREILPWKEGAAFTYWIEAVDNNDVTGPGIARSPERKWSVVSAEAKRQELQEKMHKYSESIDDLSRTQDTLRNKLEAITPK